MGIVFNAFGVQFGAFVFNALLQFVHKIFFIQIVGHRLHKFDDHFPRMPQKRVFCQNNPVFKATGTTGTLRFWAINSKPGL